MRFLTICALSSVLLALPVHAIAPRSGDAPAPALSVQGTAATPMMIQRVHDVGNIWLLTSNFGFFGDPQETFFDPFTETDGQEGFISCQFPARSGFDYLFAGGVWIGAIVGDDTLTSTGTDGWAYSDASKEFFSGDAAADTVLVRSIREGTAPYSEDAVSEQDFVVVYTDTLLTGDFNAVSINHRQPLDIRVTEKSYAWSFSYAQDMVLFDYDIENIGLKTLRDVYMGVYLDGDVGPTPRSQSDGFGNAQDDVTGFRPTDATGKVINTAWLADFDGPGYRSSSTGDGALAPSVMAVRVVRTPARQLRTTYNWWFSDDNLDVDWGPGRTFPDGNRGTPDGDVNKWLIMSGWQNANLPDSLADPVTGIKRDPNQLDAIKEGTPIEADDTRFLFSFGPFTVAPGEVLPITIGYFCAENFYRGGDPRSYDYTDLDINARWVQFIFDNPNIDTPSLDYGEDGRPGTSDPGEGDGEWETGDWFYGEDTGRDGLPNTGDEGEGNGVLDTWEDGASEDTNLLWEIEWIEHSDPVDYLASTQIDWNQEPETIEANHPELHLRPVKRFGAENGLLDEGDGVPDFEGPPPPPSPELLIQKKDANHLVFKWADNAERFVDSFIPEPARQRDFQGYRVYVSRTGVGTDFDLLKDLDRAFVPDRLEDGTIREEGGVPVVFPDSLGRNIGFASIRNTDADSTDYPYAFEYGPIPANWPLYVAVTAYDNGYPPANLGSLESSVFGNLAAVTPSTPTEAGGDLPVMAVPNPYKGTYDYSGAGWEKGPDSWTEFDRRMDFTNLKGPGVIRIFTLGGDLVETIDHVEQESRVSWDLISKNGQAVVAGIYLFAVTYDGDHPAETGKFVILK